MKIIEINNSVYQYEFLEGNHTTVFGVNITVVVDNNRALLIDTGYEVHAMQVKEDLEKKGITIDTVVFSHFHPDHISGSVLFKGCNILGSRNYHDNFARSKIWVPDNEFLKPDILINDNQTMTYGTHQLVFIETPGHSKCSVSIIIDHDLIYVGDLIMKSTNGKAVLPYIADDGSFEEHIASLEKLMDSQYKALLLAHGNYISKDKIIDEVDDRVYYLKRVKETKGELSIKEYLKNHESEYEGLKFHYINLRKFKGK